METEKRLKLLQLFYAGVLADSVANYGKSGILEEVTSRKAAEQEIMAKHQLLQLGYTTPEELFAGFSELFGCVNWKISSEDAEVVTRGSSCLLCAISRKMNTMQPCHIYCINPMRSLSKALEPGYDLLVKKTIWDSDECEFRLIKRKETK